MRILKQCSSKQRQQQGQQCSAPLCMQRLATALVWRGKGGNDNTGTQLILTAKIYSLRNNAILVRECGALAQSKRLRVCVRVR